MDHLKLPNAERGIVERGKVVDYLLNAAHPDNGGKSGFFFGLGFSRENWSTLAEALLAVAVTGEVARVVESSHGIKYVVDGKTETPKAPLVAVRTVWIIEPPVEIPRLVTAYPQEG